MSSVDLNFSLVVIKDNFDSFIFIDAQRVAPVIVCPVLSEITVLVSDL